MIKEQKATQSNSVQPNSTKNRFDEYTDMLTLRVKPVSDRYIEDLARSLVDWAVNDEGALKISQFFHKKGISSSAIQRWMKRSEKLTMAYEFALRVIGDRRELGALQNKLNVGMIMSSMAHYDPDWKALAEWRTSLKCKEEHGSKAFTVVMSCFNESHMIHKQIDTPTQNTRKPAAPQ